ncbi:hypothetical protein CJ030_MR7G016717 [Morella rubra]|uniref:Reverse transcriptase zinc-binding domain-containing protein n=1 Tax=Morella rubra TaxID=262757 RepID=A0A6A1UXL9_9ROSI|nr:hypothetical protein CJ030_MR7G016717 [Morella rubra]
MIDLDFSGNPFTWTNGREGGGLIMERLDRGLRNSDWRQLFLRATVRHLVHYASDHGPILLDTMGDSHQCPLPLRFETFWAVDPRSVQVVHDVWREDRAGSPACSLCQNLKAAKVALRWWNKHVFGEIKQRIGSLQRELDDLQIHISYHGGGLWASTKECELSRQILEAQQQDELLWKNKSRITWLQTPDLNTNFFHLSTITRRRVIVLRLFKMILGRGYVGDKLLDITKRLTSKVYLSVIMLLSPGI